MRWTSSKANYEWNEQTSNYWNDESELGSIDLEDPDGYPQY